MMFSETEACFVDKVQWNFVYVKSIYLNKILLNERLNELLSIESFINVNSYLNEESQDFFVYMNCLSNGFIYSSAIYEDVVMFYGVCYNFLFYVSFHAVS